MPETYVILSGGPSIENVTADEIRAHKAEEVIAVNRAWFIHRDVATVWSVGEQAQQLLMSRHGMSLGEGYRDTLALIRKHRPKVWTNENNYGDWYSARQDAGVPDLPVVVHRLGGGIRAFPGWETKATYGAGTFLMTLAWTFRNLVTAGGGTVHVYGCDMQGSGGAGYKWKPEETPFWANRWLVEAQGFAVARHEARHHGIAVEWHRGAVPEVART